MGVGVIADGVALVQDVLDQIRMLFSLPAVDEECGPNPMTRQQAKQRRCGDRVGAVVEGQRDRLFSGYPPADYGKEKAVPGEKRRACTEQNEHEKGDRGEPHIPQRQEDGQKWSRNAALFRRRQQPAPIL